MELMVEKAENYALFYANLITMKTKIEDSIFIKYGLKAIDIQRQVQLYNLENHPEVWSVLKPNAQLRISNSTGQQ
jgi:hypothetical protein